MGDRRGAARRLVTATVLPGVLVAVTALAAGCSSGDGASDGASDGSIVATTSPAAAPAASPVATTVAPTTPVPVDTTAAAPAAAAVPIDAPALLQQSLDSIAGGFHFRTAVTIDGAEVIVAEGDRVADGTRVTIWANGSSVAYAITPAGSWVFPEGGEWEALDDAPATADPLGALRTPVAVTGTSPDGTSASLVATVPAATLGVPGEGNADVQVLLAGTTLNEVSYLATVDGRAATVRSVLGPLVDPAPVTPPI